MRGEVASPGKGGKGKSSMVRAAWLAAELACCATGSTSASAVAGCAARRCVEPVTITIKSILTNYNDPLYEQNSIIMNDDGHMCDTLASSFGNNSYDWTFEIQRKPPRQLRSERLYSVQAEDVLPPAARTRRLPREREGECRAQVLAHAPALCLLLQHSPLPNCIRLLLII